jgi:SAM-dependent methyltransferase
MSDIGSVRSGADDRRATAAAVRCCPVCGGRARGEGVATPRPVRCAGCGLVYLDPVPAEALRQDTYGAGYYEPWQGREERLRWRLWRRRLRQVEARSAPGALLDVGCGDGLFLRVARDAGWRVEGIEFSPEGARRASERLGRPVAVGDLSAARILRGPFHVVTLWHVLEHVETPAALLAAARARLLPGGLLAVAVPNLDNLPMRLAYRLARGRPLPLYEPGGREPHLTHFSPATLAGALHRAGFAPIEVTADRCALTVPKRLIDVAAALLSRLCGRLLTDAIVAFARVPPP